MPLWGFYILGPTTATDECAGGSSREVAAIDSCKAVALTSSIPVYSRRIAGGCSSSGTKITTAETTGCNASLFLIVGFSCLFITAHIRRRVLIYLCLLLRVT